MLFITEGDLKNQYRQSPFKTFELQVETRLTPEARQFLVDRQILITTAEKVTKASVLTFNPEILASCQKVSSFFLLAFSFLLDSQVGLAETVMNWHEQLTKAQNTYETGKCLSESDVVRTIEPHTSCDIKAFHVQLPGGRALAILNGLKFTLRELLIQLESRCDKTTENQGLPHLMSELCKIEESVSYTISSLLRSETDDN